MVHAASASDNLTHILRVLALESKVIIVRENIEVVQYPSKEQMVRAVEIALRDPQVQEILQKAKVDGYQVNVDARPMFDLQELGETEKGKAIALIPREGVAVVEIRILKEYDEGVGLKVYEVIVDLLEEKVTEIREHPEARKPKPTNILETPPEEEKLIPKP